MRVSLKGVITAGFLVVLGLAAGILVGVSYVSAAAEHLANQVLALERARDEERAYLAYRRGNFEQVKCALMSYIWKVDRGLDALGEPARTEAVRSIALAYARLGVSAERAGRGQDLKELLALARSTLAKVGEYPPDEQILRLVTEVDEQRDTELLDCTSGGGRPK